MERYERTSIDEMSKGILSLLDKDITVRGMMKCQEGGDRDGSYNLTITYYFLRKEAKESARYDRDDPDFNEDSRNPTRKGMELLVRKLGKDVEVGLSGVKRDSARIKIYRPNNKSQKPSQ